MSATTVALVAPRVDDWSVAYDLGQATMRMMLAAADAGSAAVTRRCVTKGWRDACSACPRTGVIAWSIASASPPTARVPRSRVPTVDRSTRWSTAADGKSSGGWPGYVTLVMSSWSPWSQVGIAFRRVHHQNRRSGAISRLLTLVVSSAVVVPGPTAGPFDTAIVRCIDGLALVVGAASVSPMARSESMISIARTTNRNVTRWRDGQMVLRWDRRRHAQRRAILPPHQGLQAVAPTRRRAGPTCPPTARRGRRFCRCRGLEFTTDRHPSSNTTRGTCSND